MKIIVIGVGKVGYTVADLLSAENNDVTIIDCDKAALDNADRELDVFCVCGNGASVSVLREAGIEDCDLLIALTNSDELNLLCCLLAKQLGVGNTIARVRNPEYNDELGIIRDALGLTAAVNPERIAALEMLRVIKFPYAKKIDVFSRGKVDLVSFDISPKCTLCGKPIKESFSRISSKVLACAVERGDHAFIPYGDTVLQDKDTLAILIVPAEIPKFFKDIGLSKGTVHNVMIVGGGKISYYLADSLCRMNLNVTVVEKDPDTAEMLALRLPDATIICGDGTNRTLLAEEGLTDSDAFVSVTGVDEENILISLYAKSVVPQIKTITKVNRQTFRGIIHNMELDSVIYPKDTTANRVLRQVRAMNNNMGSNIENLYKIINNKAEALEFNVSEDCGLLGQSLEELRLHKNVIIGTINRGGKVFIPHGKDYLKPGDKVIVVTTISGLTDLDDIKE